MHVYAKMSSINIFCSFFSYLIGKLDDDDDDDDIAKTELISAMFGSPFLVVFFVGGGGFFKTDFIVLHLFVGLCGILDSALFLPKVV